MTSSLEDDEVQAIKASSTAVGCAQSAGLCQQYLTLSRINEDNIETARYYARELRDRAETLCEELDADEEGSA